MFERIDNKPLLKALFWAVPLWAILLGASLGLTDQEAYYWTWAKNLDWCYYEHPPLQAWVTRLFTSIFGDSAFVIRLPANIFRLLTFTVFLYWVTHRWNRAIARRALWIILGSFISLASGLIALPDSYFAFFAMMTILYAEEGKATKTGLVLGLAALSKWTAACLIPGVIAAYLMHYKGPRYKSLFKVALVAILLQAPVIYWNAQNDWASFAFHLVERQKEFPGLWSFIKNLSTFLSAQILLGGLSLLVALWYLIQSFFSSTMSAPLLAKKNDQNTYVPIWIWVLPFFIIFGYSAGKGEMRFYWAAFALFPLTAWIAANIGFTAKENENSFEYKLLFTSLFSMLLTSVILIFPVGAYLKPFTDTYKKYDLRHSPRGDLIGWQEWAETDLTKLRLTGDNVGFIASDFRLASQIAWALNLELPQYGTVGKPFQYKFWPRTRNHSYDKYVFFADNRRRRRSSQNKLCSHRLYWEKKEIFLKGELVKVIHYAICEKLKN